MIESAVEFEKFSSGVALQVDDALRGVELIITEVSFKPGYLKENIQSLFCFRNRQLKSRLLCFKVPSIPSDLF